MRFKDRLKALRNKQNMTQKKLSEAIFVSRSAVAKWENGLGLPSIASYEALLLFFGVSKEEFPLCEAGEEEEIKRNVRIHFIKEVISWILILTIAILPFILVYKVMHGYGFTSIMAAGEVWEDSEIISTQDYDFYLSTPIYILDDNGEVASRVIDGFCVVEKSFYGYQKIYTESSKRTVYTIDGEFYGIIYTFEGEQQYYNIFKSKKTLLEFDFEEPSATVDMNIISKIFVNGIEIELTHHSFFVSDSYITEFKTEDKTLIVKNK